ncbi:peptidase C12, ubiquitin carboxyl-terminal hydrolase [Dipodascopsis uninucleata]
MVNAFVPLESNPEVLTQLAHTIGLEQDLAFHDVYSLDDPELLEFIPRPAYALLFVFPISETYESFRREQDAGKETYEPTKPEEADVIWVKQTIKNACGTYALLHSALNGPAFDHVIPGSLLSTFKKDLVPLSTAERAVYIESSVDLERAHASVASQGETAAPDANDDVELHYVAFVKASSGILYELDGRRAGPIALCELSPQEDVLSPSSTNYIKKFMDREAKSGTDSAMSPSYLSFSLLALAPSMD